MHQQHEDFPLHPKLPPHQFLHLGDLSPTHLSQALIDPPGRVMFILRQVLVFFDDLSDPLKAGSNLRLGAGVLQTLLRRFRIGQYLI
jgi:hypothetical protein